MVLEGIDLRSREIQSVSIRNMPEIWLRGFSEDSQDFLSLIPIYTFIAA